MIRVVDKERKKDFRILQLSAKDRENPGLQGLR